MNYYDDCITQVNGVVPENISAQFATCFNGSIAIYWEKQYTGYLSFMTNNEWKTYNSPAKMAAYRSWQFDKNGYVWGISSRSGCAYRIDPSSNTVRVFENLFDSGHEMVGVGKDRILIANIFDNLLTEYRCENDGLFIAQQIRESRWPIRALSAPDDSGWFWIVSEYQNRNESCYKIRYLETSGMRISDLFAIQTRKNMLAQWIQWDEFVIFDDINRKILISKDPRMSWIDIPFGSIYDFPSCVEDEMSAMHMFYTCSRVHDSHFVCISFDNISYYIDLSTDRSHVICAFRNEVIAIPMGDKTFLASYDYRFPVQLEDSFFGDPEVRIPINNGHIFHFPIENIFLRSSFYYNIDERIKPGLSTSKRMPFR